MLETKGIVTVRNTRERAITLSKGVNNERGSDTSG